MTRTILFNAVDVPSNSACLMPDNGLAMLAACLDRAGQTVEICDIATARTVQDHISGADRIEIRRLLEMIRKGPQHITQASIAAMTLLEMRIAAGLEPVYMRALDDVDRRIGWSNVDLLGLKLWVGSGAQLALRLAANLARRHPGLRVVAGGPLAMLRPQALLRDHPVLTAVCVGHGEESIVGLAEHCAGRRALESVPNLMIRDGALTVPTASRSLELADLPVPTYDPSVYPAMAGDQKLPVLCIDESRGCPMGCHFCAHARLSGREWRHLTPDRIIAQMDAGHRQTGAKAFRFSGSFTPSETYRGVALALAERGAPYLFSGFAHVNGVEIDDLPLLRRAGLVALFFGIESGAWTLLTTTLGKRTLPARIKCALRAAMDAGIFVCGSVIFPAPGETETTAAQTRALLIDLFADRDHASVLVLPALLQPGSRWWEEMERFGFEGDREAIVEALSHRRTRHLLPMNHFEPLPYHLDGIPFREQCARTGALTRALSDRGILTNMGHDAALFAQAARYRPLTYREIDHEMFLLADGDRITEIIRRMAA